VLFQKLKDAKKNPAFMLKHIKDIRSPIAVAHQKHAARKASSIPKLMSMAMSDPAVTKANNGREASKSSDSEVTVSYAVAIYPYMAEQEDEFDVVV
jgi:bZIP factor